MQTQGSSSIKDNIITVFGSKTATCLEPLDLSVSDGCRVEGFVSRPGAGCGRYTFKVIQSLISALSTTNGEIFTRTRIH